MYSSKITLFNYYESATTGDAYWYPHVLSNVDLNTDRGAIIKKYGPDTADNAQLHIPYRLHDGVKVISEESKKPSSVGTVMNLGSLCDSMERNVLDDKGLQIFTMYLSEKIYTEWRSPKEWERQINDLLPGTIRFSPDSDFFWAGEWDKGIVNDKDYRGGFYQYMNQSRDNVFKITSVGGPYSLIPHFEILAK